MVDGRLAVEKSFMNSSSGFLVEQHFAFSC